MSRTTRSRGLPAAIMQSPILPRHLRQFMSRDRFVSADRLAALVAGFAPGAPVTLSATESIAMIVCGNSHSRLSIVPWNDLPDVLAIDSAIANVEVGGGECLLLLEPLSAAAARNSTRFYLCGIFLHTVGDQLIAVCTDGVRLIRVGISAAEFSATRDLILPQEAAMVLRWLVTRTKPDKVMLRRSQNLLAVTGPDFEFVSRLIDFKYPAYEAVVPVVSPNAVPLTAPNCSRRFLVWRRSRLLTRRCWRCLGLTQGRSKLFLARQPDDGADAIAAQAHGAAKIAVPISQLSAMIDEFKGERIQLEAAGPLVIRSKGEKLALLMPSAWNFERGGFMPRGSCESRSGTGGARCEPQMKKAQSARLRFSKLIP